MTRLATVDAEGEIPAEHPAQEVEGGSFDFLHSRSAGEALAQSYLIGFVPVPQEAIVPNFHETLWEHMHEETADELESGDGHDFPTVVVPVVAPFERDIAVVNAEDAMVRDSDAVSIPSEILNDAIGRFEWRFAIDHPFLVMASTQEVHEMLIVSQVGLTSEKHEVLRLQQMKELAAELARHDLDGDKELFARAFPSPDFSQPPGRDDAVDMRMERQCLSPSMQDGSEPKRSANEILVRSQFLQRLRDSLK